MCFLITIIVLCAVILPLLNYSKEVLCLRFNLVIAKRKSSHSISPAFDHKQRIGQVEDVPFTSARSPSIRAAVFEAEPTSDDWNFVRGA